MKKTISTKDGTHKWEDAREGDFVVINKARHEVTRGVDGVLTARPSIEFRPVVMHYWQSIGAHLEREVEEYPHGLLPTEPGAVIRCDGDVYQRTVVGNAWWGAGEDVAVMTEDLQQFADAHGFTRLVPETEVEAAHMEGWKQGIRDAAALVARMRLEDTAQTIRAEFPEAFTQDGGQQDSSTVSVTFTKRSLCAFVECAEAAFNEAEMVDLGSGTSAWTTLLKARATCEQDGGEQA